MARRFLALLLFVLGAGAWAKEFVVWTGKLDGSSAVLSAKIEKGYHLYGLKPVEDGPVETKIVPVPPLQAAGPPTQSTAEKRFDPNFQKEIEQFADEATFTLPLKNGATDGKVKVTFQVCNDSVCQPPKTVEVPLSGGAAKEATVVRAETGGLFTFLLAAVGFGFLSLLTPCVFPMIPITVTFFTKRAQKAGGSALPSAALYAGGIIGAFTVFGLLVTVVFGASGLQTFAANPWVNLAMGVIFVLLALSLFGVIQVGVPSSIASKFDGTGRKGWIAPVLMGLTFTLTSFTCTSPFVGTILVGAANGDLWYPLVGMLGFSAAFALPFFFLALFPQALSKLPKAGVWMETMKGAMGFLELAAAVKFFSNIDQVFGWNLISRSTFLWIWIAIFAAMALYLVGVLKIKSAPVPAKFGPVRVGFIGAIVALCVFLGLGARGRSTGELEAFLPPGPNAWPTDYERAVASSRSQNRPMLINFTGKTCTNCRWMEANMFPRPGIASLIDGRFVKVELFTDRPTAEDERNQALQKKLAKTVALPVYVVVRPDGSPDRIFEGSTRDEAAFAKFLKGS